MNHFMKIKNEGISLKSMHRLMIAITIIMTILLVAGIIKTGLIYHQLTDATNQYTELQDAAKELMDASDYLTDKVQRFTVTLDPADMEAYFDEADCVQRREKAIAKMQQISGDSDAFHALSAAMSESTEYTAMKIICTATNTVTVPNVIVQTPLPSEISNMTYDEQLNYARSMVHDEIYYEKKFGIRNNMDYCLQALIDDATYAQSIISTRLRRYLISIMALVIIQSLSTVLILRMTSYLGITPIIKGVQQIGDNQEIPVTGSYEFRYLAKAYNKMCKAFQQSIQHLNYDASHDKLTGLYNRTGYDMLKSSINLKTTAVLLIDADKFKEINDTYGHATGDDVLKKISDSLKHTFRHEDYICRLGGDEFVVFMLHMELQREELIRLKIDLINKRLSDTSDGIPKISISVGVAFGVDEPNIETLIKHADEALYQMKEAGRRGCVFYSGTK